MNFLELKHLINLILIMINFKFVKRQLPVLSIKFLLQQVNVNANKHILKLIIPVEDYVHLMPILINKIDALVFLVLNEQVEVVSLPLIVQGKISNGMVKVIIVFVSQDIIKVRMVFVLKSQNVELIKFYKE